MVDRRRTVEVKKRQSEGFGREIFDSKWKGQEER